MPRFEQRPSPPGVAPRDVPGHWCTRCGRTRNAVRVHGSTRMTYSCPHGCDDYDPKRGRI